MTSFIVILVLVIAIVGMGIFFAIASFYRKVDQGRALIVNKMREEPEVTFTGAVVLPVIHRAEVMDISVKTIELSRSGHEGLICQDNIRADIKVSFYVRVSKTTEDVLRVAQSIGCARASDQSTLEELFVAKFSEALKTVGKKLDFEQLYTQRDDFKDQIIEVIGRDLNGYVLEDAAIDYLEQTPLSKLDRENILDAQGIRKITQITVQQNLHTNQLEQDFLKEKTRQDLEAEEAILELQRRKAEAEATQKREIETVRAREEAETAKVREEERLRAEMAKLEADEQLQVAAQNKLRQVEVAEKDRERVVGIKEEQVQRDRDIEVIGREREVERQRIAKEMELEVKRKEIAEVVRSRIAVDKSVAEEEERIKDLRVSAEAERQKNVVVIEAEAKAEEHLVMEIKAAEAKEKRAEFEARERLVLANAQLEEAERVAKSKTKLAEGVQAEVAAEGLAHVRVEEAQAVALEKTGMAQARVILERKRAEAQGSEAEGMAKEAVRERALSIEVQVTRDRKVAEAEGMLAEAKAVETYGEAKAAAERAMLMSKAEGVEAAGKAEAAAVRERMTAEASGLEAKLVAMQKMEGAAREHEEFRMQLSHQEKVQLEGIRAQAAIAEQQAKVLGTALGEADIQIMGGDGQFLDSLVKATSLGQGFEKIVESSPIAQGLLGSAIKKLSSDEPAADLPVNASQNAGE